MMQHSTGKGRPRTCAFRSRGAPCSVQQVGPARERCWDMKMPWRSRSRAELLQALHHEVTTARDELRATVVDAVAVAEGRLRKDLDLHEEMQELVTRLDTTCAEYETHDDEMRHMLTRVADAYELLARRIEEERAERRLLVGALEQLAQSMQI